MRKLDFKFGTLKILFTDYMNPIKKYSPCLLLFIQQKPCLTKNFSLM